MADLSLDEISERIAESILEETHLNKQSLCNVIRPNLKIWLKQSDKCKKSKASPEKLQTIVDQKQLEIDYWKNKFRNIIGKDKMAPYYDELNQMLIEENYKSI